MVEVQRGFTWLITSSIQSMMTPSGYISKNVPHPNGYNYSLRERTINSTGFIMNMIKEIYEHKQENYKIYLINRPEYVETSMTLPELKAILVISKDNANIQVLQGVVSHDVLQMLNAGDISGVITKLDVAVGDESNVIEMVTRKYQDDLKVKEYELRVAIENPKYKPENESISITNKRTAITELKRKIACIEERVKEVENCPICYDDFTNPTITPCCSNKFCLNCIAAALNSKSVCPMCKSELVMKNLLIISDKTKAEIANTYTADIESKKKKSANTTDNKAITYNTLLEELQRVAPEYSKYENMDKIFELNNKNTIKKYLIFTEYESALNAKITSILDKYGLTYARIRGTGASITSMVEDYRQSNDKINVLLINSKYFGSGLNLENTSDIIILHKMQADIEMQVIGRAHRYGRKDSLRVWKLYYQNEVTI
jgi:RNA polymerase subunit RPABC4/transcription elongation factor Spt4